MKLLHKMHSVLAWTFVTVFVLILILGLCAYWQFCVISSMALTVILSEVQTENGHYSTTAEYVSYQRARR